MVSVPSPIALEVAKFKSIDVVAFLYVTISVSAPPSRVSSPNPPLSVSSPP